MIRGAEKAGYKVVVLIVEMSRVRKRYVEIKIYD